MATFATKAIAAFLLEARPTQPDYCFLGANHSGDKKASTLSLIQGRGRRATAEAVIPAALVRRLLRVEVTRMLDYWRMSAISGVLNGTLGMQGHYANVLAALFIATGQDAARVAESVIGITRMDLAEEGALYASVTLPNLVVAGGTGLPAQRACLDLMGLAGNGRAAGLAEAAAALCLADELSIIAALAAGHFAQAHRKGARSGVAVMSGLSAADERVLPLHHRLWIYQRERFPVFAHRLLIAVMAVAMQSWAMRLVGAVDAYRILALLGAFAAIFGFFLQLRIADEFKDRRIGARYRPKRLVPRGLVSLEELAFLAGGFALLQLLVAWLSGPLALIALAVVWGYGALMTWEFGCSAWLRDRLSATLISHMAILPLIAAFDVAVQWSAMGGLPADWPRLLLLSTPVFALVYANGLALEIGRKLRCPADERPGVETYSKIWGLGPALLVWCACLALAGLSLILTQSGSSVLVVSARASAALLALGLLVAALLALSRKRWATTLPEPTAALLILISFSSCLPTGDVMTQTAVVFPQEIHLNPHCGGKAEGLAQLKRLGMAVPDWFVMPADAPAVAGVSAGRLARAARSEIVRALHRLGGLSFAVRLSGASEDGTAQSFASQFDSLLDVRGEAVCEATGPGSSGCAVIVQRMLRLALSGVAFTANPADGSREVCVIAAVKGTAAHLVAGRIDGDTCRVGLDGQPQDVEWAIQEGRLYLL